MQLPTANEINVFDSLDERAAAEHFLGKSLEEAERLFEHNFLFYQEDLMWMGPTAFEFYVVAAVRYLRRVSPEAGSDAVNTFASILEFQQEVEHDWQPSVVSEIKACLEYILSHWTTFEVDGSIYGDLRERYDRLLRLLSAEGTCGAR